MSRSYNYAVIQFSAHPSRNERLNLGLVIFGEGGLDVRPAKQLDKLKAISAALDPEAVRSTILRLPEIDAFALKQGIADAAARLSDLCLFAPVSFSAMGQFFAPDAAIYEQCVGNLLTKLVEPEPAPTKFVRKRPSRLLTTVKSVLKARRILAKRGEGLEAHRVVTGHEIAEGLSADLLLKNGAFHVVEIVDASADETPIKRAIQTIGMSALVFEHARMSFGDENTNAKLIYQASVANERALTPSLRAAEHQGAKLVNWESQDERAAFLSRFAALATPLEEAKEPSVHASAQSKFTLN
jgi:hypothetical protein